mmetsp:Transcript_86629/g.242684  ORF Transcript_86629/g.242684 Transcript_86629/m.242684 type:complete len:248 (-) Transcript_86629:280-1023(-)
MLDYPSFKQYRDDPQVEGDDAAGLFQQNNERAECTNRGFYRTGRCTEHKAAQVELLAVREEHVAAGQWPIERVVARAVDYTPQENYLYLWHGSEKKHGDLGEPGLRGRGGRGGHPAHHSASRPGVEQPRGLLGGDRLYVRRPTLGRPWQDARPRRRQQRQGRVAKSREQAGHQTREVDRKACRRQPVVWGGRRDRASEPDQGSNSRSVGQRRGLRFEHRHERHHCRDRGTWEASADPGAHCRQGWMD